VEAANASQLLFDRFDAAHAKVGMAPSLGEIPWRIRTALGKTLEAECRAELDALNKQAAEDKTGKTVVIEAARGGPNGSGFPLTPPHGYETSFQHLSPGILEKASVLYVWVDPKESR